MTAYLPIANLSQATAYLPIANLQTLYDKVFDLNVPFGDGRTPASLIEIMADADGWATKLRMEPCVMEACHKISIPSQRDELEYVVFVDGHQVLLGARLNGLGNGRYNNHMTYQVRRGTASGSAPTAAALARPTRTHTRPRAHRRSPR